jgi:hypothetical protein
VATSFGLDIWVTDTVGARSTGSPRTPPANNPAQHTGRELNYRPQTKEDPMNALTHQITSRTLVAAAFLVAALAGLIVTLVLGMAATSGHSPGGQGGRGTDFRQPGCLVCSHAR